MNSRCHLRFPSTQRYQIYTLGEYTYFQLLGNEEVAPPAFYPIFRVENHVQHLGNVGEEGLEQVFMSCISNV